MLAFELGAVVSTRAAHGTTEIAGESPRVVVPRIIPMRTVGPRGERFILNLASDHGRMACRLRLDGCNRKFYGFSVDVSVLVFIMRPS